MGKDDMLLEKLAAVIAPREMDPTPNHENCPECNGARDEALKTARRILSLVREDEEGDVAWLKTRINRWESFADKAMLAMERAVNELAAYRSNVEPNLIAQESVLQAKYIKALRAASELQKFSSIFADEKFSSIFPGAYANWQKRNAYILARAEADLAGYPRYGDDYPEIARANGWEK